MKKERRKKCEEEQNEVEKKGKKREKGRIRKDERNGMKTSEKCVGKEIQRNGEEKNGRGKERREKRNENEAERYM